MGCGRGKNTRVGVVCLKIFCLRVVLGSDRLRLRGAAVQFGNVGCNTVRFGFADGLRVV